MELAPGAPAAPGDPPAAAAPSADVVPAIADVTSPRTILDSRKVRSGARSATFVFHADEVGSSFRCVLDRRKAAA
jgi:hypothetical protein